MNKTVIKRNFSRYAHLYDKYADIQRYSSSQLAKLLKKGCPGEILEIGCGTGIYTGMLKRRFRRSALTVIDMATDDAIRARLLAK